MGQESCRLVAGPLTVQIQGVPRRLRFCAAATCFMCSIEPWADSGFSRRRRTVLRGAYRNASRFGQFNLEVRILLVDRSSLSYVDFPPPESSDRFAPSAVILSLQSFHECLKHDSNCSAACWFSGHLFRDRVMDDRVCS